MLLRRKVYRGKTEVIHNFIETTPRQLAVKKNYVLYFGRLSAEKGIDILLQVCKMLPHIPFVLAGSGPLEEQCAKCGLANVSFVGFKGGKELEELIAQAAFSVYIPVWYENCPLSVLESQSVGTPVLATAIGGIPELVEDGVSGRLLHRWDVPFCAQQIEAFWNDKELLGKMQQNCLDKNTRMTTLEDYTKQLLKIYHKCLNQNSEPWEENDEKKAYSPNNFAARQKNSQKLARIVVAQVLTAVMIVTAVFAGVTAWTAWDNSKFTETIYPLSSEKISSKIRVILLTDLHEYEFGVQNQQLVDRIQKLKPDLILMAGDMINKRNPNTQVALSLCKQLVETAPVYYSLGNHENEVVFGQDMIFAEMEAKDNGSGELAQFIQDDSFLKALEKTGVTVLLNQKAEIEVQGNWVDIGGINTNLSSMWPYSGDFITGFATQNTERFKILMCHRPEVVGEYLGDTPIDLCVSGHTHGGAVRIPGIGGIYTHEQGFDPELDAGLFHLNQTKLVVSRGLGGFPRFLNRPELVVLDIS